MSYVVNRNAAAARANPGGVGVVAQPSGWRNPLGPHRHHKAHASDAAAVADTSSGGGGGGGDTGTGYVNLDALDTTPPTDTVQTDTTPAGPSRLWLVAALVAVLAAGGAVYVWRA